MKIIKKKSLVSLLLLTTFMFLVSVSFVSAVITPTTPTGLPDTSVPAVLQKVINWIVGIVVLVSALVIVIAGVMWATAGGDEDRQGSARKLLISGVIGLVIALAAYAMVKVVTGLFY